MDNPKTIRAKIQNRETVAKDTIFVEFRLPHAVDFLPGQSFRVTLPSGENRFFSVANSPSRKDRLTTITRVRESPFKKFLNTAPLGSEVQISNIAGVFLLPRDVRTPLMFIAGGVGITPFLSMLDFAIEKVLPYKITLLYSNRDRRSAVFLEKLQKLGERLPGFELARTMTRDRAWSGERGRIDISFIKKYTPDYSGRNFMICGSPAMTNAIFGQLIEAGIEPWRVRTEEFTGY